MTQSEFADFLENHIVPKLRETRAAGQKEYAHEQTNAFRNFEALAGELGLDRKEILWVYFRKHIDGILAWIRGHKSQRESVQGRLMDAIVYLTLLWGMAHEEEGDPQ